MGRRRNDELFWMQPIMGIVGLVALLCMINPDIRNLVVELSFLVFWFVCVLAVIGIGFLAYKIFRSNRTGIGPYSSYVAVPRPCNDLESKSPAFFSQPDFAPSVDPGIKPIERLRKIDWYQFERFVAYIYKERDFNVTRKGGANPDGGVDLIIQKDGQISAVQCKQWKTRDVGVKAVREFLGALTDAQIQKGIFITLNGYTGEAKQLADKHGIEIINEKDLSSMMEGLDMHDPAVLDILNDSRKICPKCDREMILRIAVKGPNPGQSFWGCSGYPKCHFTMPR